jgi:hypothetical protein
LPTSMAMVRTCARAVLWGRPRFLWGRPRFLWGRWRGQLDGWCGRRWQQPRPLTGSGRAGAAASRGSCGHGRGRQRPAARETHRLEVIGGGNGKASLNDIHAQLGQLACNVELLLGGQRGAGRLLACTRARVQGRGRMALDARRPAGTTALARRIRDKPAGQHVQTTCAIAAAARSHGRPLRRRRRLQMPPAPLPTPRSPSRSVVSKMRT